MKGQPRLRDSPVELDIMRVQHPLIVVLVASAFGPYLVGGVRTEQLVIYGVAAILFLSAPWRWLGARLPGTIVSVVVVWGFYALIGAVGVIWPPVNSTPWAYQDGPFAGLDNLFLPLATLGLLVMNVRPSDAHSGLRVIAKAIGLLGAINGAVALVQTRVDLTSVLRPFWAASDPMTGEPTVSELAATLGRYSGIFNQPAEAGMLYGIAGLCLIYVYAERPRMLYPALTWVVVGGILSVSKVFLLVGAPIILWQIWGRANGKVLAAVTAMIAAVGLAQSRVVEWAGLDYLLRLFAPGQIEGTSLVALYTAGRFGSDSTLRAVVAETLSREPLFGFGATGLRVPYDNAWVEAAVVAGLVGAICYTIVLVIWAYVANQLSGREGALAWGLVLLAAGSSLGVPALTANRAGMLLWAVMVLLMLEVAHQERSHPETLSRHGFSAAPTRSAVRE